MKRWLIICITAVFFLSLKGDERYLPWTKELQENYSWDLYTKKSVPGGFAALTVVKREFEVAYADELLVIDYKCLLDTEESCYERRLYKKELPSKELLAHEQLHFDLYEYYRWVFFQRVKKIKTTDLNKFLRELKKIRREVELECDREQNKYDKETNHSIKREVQKQWEKNFYAKMDQLKPPTSSRLEVRLK